MRLTQMAAAHAWALQRRENGIDNGEARDFAVWFAYHWPNGDVESAWQAWLSALGTIR